MKIFHDQISTKECCRPGEGQTCNLLISSWARIQLSHRGRLSDINNVKQVRYIVTFKGGNLFHTYSQLTGYLDWFDFSEIFVKPCRLVSICTFQYKEKYTYKKNNSDIHKYLLPFSKRNSLKGNNLFTRVAAMFKDFL